MRTTLILASCLPVLTTAKFHQDLTQVNFEALLEENTRALVSFSSFTLNSLAPYNTVFRLSSTNLSTPFVTINCDTEPSLCAAHDINSYPTIRLFSREDEGNEVVQTRYRGPRTVKAITSFVKRRELPVLSHLEVADMDFRRVDSIVFIAFLSPDDTTSFSTFSLAAEKHHFEHAFGYTLDASIAASESVQVPSIIAYRNDDGDNLIFSGPFSQADLENFLIAGSTPIIRTFREKFIGEFMRRDKLTVYIFTHSPSSTPLRRILTPVAKKYQKHVVFAVVDLARYADMPSNFGVEGEGEEEAMVVHAPGNDHVFFWMRGARVEVEGVEEMLLRILKGEAENRRIFWGKEGHDEL